VITNAQRRARLATRHALTPASRLASVEAVADRLVALHSTEPPTVHLGVAARTDLSVADVEQALYADRSVVKQLAMRRTLFTFPRDLLPHVWGSTSARVAAEQWRVISRDIERAGLAKDGTAWLRTASAAVLERLSDGSALSAAELREQVPEIEGRIEYAVGKSYGGSQPLAPRVLVLLGAEGRIMRAENTGHWRTSRPRWAAIEHWLDEVPARTDSQEGYATLTARYLAAFGPATETDIVWWFGATKGIVRQALADIGAVSVDLEDGLVGYVLPDDSDRDAVVDDWAALLPTLDSTSMGWKQRDWYLAPEDVPYLVDTNGNIGTTAWWNGRIVGAWVQDPEGVVSVVTRPGTDDAAVERLAAEAERLTRFLDGVVITSVYKSQVMKGEPLP